MPEYQVSYSRKISTAPYETLQMGMVMTFSEEVKPSVAFNKVSRIVNDELDAELEYLQFRKEENKE